MSDTISFSKAIVSHATRDYTATKIIINGEDFKDARIHMENEYEYQNAEWLCRQLSDPQEAVAILTCKCTVDECGGLYCKVTETDNTVVWSDFHTNSTVNVYESMPPLHFDKIAYIAALDELKTLLGKPITTKGATTNTSISS